MSGGWFGYGLEIMLFQPFEILKVCQNHTGHARLIAQNGSLT